MNIILKIDSARKLKKHISTHPHIASDTGCQTVLDQLYQLTQMPRSTILQK